MGLRDYTRHQQGIIKRYYENRDQIGLQRLAELVTELYLSDAKKAARHWKAVGELLERLQIPADRRDHLMKERKPELLANLVKELQSRG